MLWLDGCLGFERRLALSQAEVVRLWTDTLVKLPCVRGGGWGPCLVFALCPGIHLQRRKNHGKTSFRVPERCLAKQCWTRFVPSTWSLFCVGLDWPVDPGRTKLARQATWVTPRWALNICRIAELRRFPQQLTLSRDSRLGLWYGGEERNSQIGVHR